MHKPQAGCKRFDPGHGLGMSGKQEAVCAKVCGGYTIKVDQIDAAQVKPDEGAKIHHMGLNIRKTADRDSCRIKDCCCGSMSWYAPER